MRTLGFVGLIGDVFIEGRRKGTTRRFSWVCKAESKESPDSVLHWEYTKVTPGTLLFGTATVLVHALLPASFLDVPNRPCLLGHCDKSTYTVCFFTDVVVNWLPAQTGKTPIGPDVVVKLLWAPEVLLALPTSNG